MGYSGHVESGKVVFDEPTELADGTRVRIEIVAGSTSEAFGDACPSLADQLSAFIGRAENLPEDWAENHDAYLRNEHSS
ncbi:MAG: hypothetical protein KF886_25145 [Candidatus Hydrogenedentes bacterium]|nr:hypothetical protein [Candidatus Hydrogenedentota bacterium]